LTYLAYTPPSYFTGIYANAHIENPASPYYTSAGAHEGLASDLDYGSGGPTGQTPLDYIDAWLGAPFHGQAILNPDLTAVAFAYNPATGDAGLDVGSGIDGSLPPPTSPVLFPGPGLTTNLGGITPGEVPNALQTCGWSQGGGLPIPIGLPLIARLTQDPDPSLTAQLLGPGGLETSAAGALCIVDDRTGHTASHS